MAPHHTTQATPAPLIPKPSPADPARTPSRPGTRIQPPGGYKGPERGNRRQSISSDDSHPGPLLDRGPNQLPCRIPARVPSGVALSPVDVLTNCDGPGESYSPEP